MKTQNNSGFSRPVIIILIIVGILAAASIGGVYLWRRIKPIEQSLPCVTDAKICPDGTSVGRVLPNCEFAPCPEIKDKTAGWQTYRNESYGFEFKYPLEWTTGTTYNDKKSGSLINIKFTTGEAGSGKEDEFTALVSCFNAKSVWLGGDPEKITKTLTIDNITTSIYQQDENKFIIPVMKDGLDIKFIKTSPPSNIGCGIFFYGLTDLSETKENIITSFKFIKGFDSFVSSVIKHFEFKPPVKG